MPQGPKGEKRPADINARTAFEEAVKQRQCERVRLSNYAHGTATEMFGRARDQ
jgi:hypothetical protein